jgi:BirA family biotin operon repressor/biotin-[acetyl-CoA-carboxylase] ligase
MNIYTDSTEYAATVFNIQESWTQTKSSCLTGDLQMLYGNVFGEGTVYKSASKMKQGWANAFVTGHALSSHFDLLIELSRKITALPDGLICLAGSGQKFHGLRGRPWQALEGNIHLTVLFTPNRKILHFHTGFPILAAVSLIETIDSLEGFEDIAQIKWINDIWINGGKVAGFLTHISSIKDAVSDAIIGIGLNVGRKPEIPADEYVPRAESLVSLASDPSVCRIDRVLDLLLARLFANYDLLLSGKYEQLLEIYRKRSLVTGRTVRVLADSPEEKPEEIASGRVKTIGDHLELNITGHPQPITRGRLVLID